MYNKCVDRSNWLSCSKILQSSLNQSRIDRVALRVRVGLVATGVYIRHCRNPILFVHTVRRLARCFIVYSIIGRHQIGRRNRPHQHVRVDLSSLTFIYHQVSQVFFRPCMRGLINLYLDLQGMYDSLGLILVATRWFHANNVMAF